MKNNKTKTTLPVSEKVVTRIAPSPTGSFHIGTARTALFNYLFAKHHKGLFIVRFEDTDSERSDKKYEKEILDALNWLGLTPDRVERQSDRSQIYKKYIEALLKEGHAYRSREPSKRNPGQEVEVIRFRNQNQVVVFDDTLRGKTAIDMKDLGDFVIARGVDDPLYNLAVVIDDTEMGVTHILRGDDHIINTPRQILLLKAIKAPIPVYTHIPLIHSPSGGKLSKRKDSVSVNVFKEQGYLPEAVINTIALLGWNPKNDKEDFTLKELVNVFSSAHIQKKSAVFNEKKLQWFNRRYMQRLPEDHVRKVLEPMIADRFSLDSKLSRRAVRTVCQNVRERGFLFSAVRDDIAHGEYDFLFTPPVYPWKILLPKSDLPDEECSIQVCEGLEYTYRVFSSIDTDKEWNEGVLQKAIWSYAEDRGKSLVLWPLRVALSGKQTSPGPFVIACSLGREETLSRIQGAVAMLKKNAVV